MAESGSRGILSIGIFLIILVISIMLYAVNLIGWLLIVPLILLLSGCWTMVLAGMRSSNPQKYERGPFSTFAWGLVMVALGGSWFLYAYTSNSLYALAVLLLVLGILAIVTALRRK